MVLAVSHLYVDGERERGLGSKLDVCVSFDFTEMDERGRSVECVGEVRNEYECLHAVQRGLTDQGH